MTKTVVYGSDGGDVDRLKASIWSVKKFIGEDTEIFVLSDALSNEDVQNATIIDPTPILKEAGFFPDGWNRKWPYATLYRLALPLVEELKDKERVLYLDTDTLVMSADANELFTMDMGDYEVAGAIDSNGKPSRISKCIMDDICKEAYYSVYRRIWHDVDMRKVTYIGAGVIVWMPKKINENGTGWYMQRLKWFWEAETRGKFDYLDQDFINSMMKMKRDLDKKFDCYMDKDPKYYPTRAINHYIVGTKDGQFSDAGKMGYETAPGTEKIVVYSSDGRDSDRVAMSMRSVRKALGPSVKFFILTRLKKYPGNPDATLVDPSDKLKEVGFFPDGWNRKWPYECLFRLAVPILDEFKDLDRVLYLDTDTLVRSRHAEDLFTIESRGHEAYGAADIENRQWDINNIVNGDIPNKVRLELKKKLPGWDRIRTRAYINSGIVVLFLDNIRKNGLDFYKYRMKLFWEGIKLGKYRHPDQDFINVLMDVDPSASVKFNHFGGDVKTNCVIQHFVGGSKVSMAGTARAIGC